jgi:hypothetical protein
MVDPAIISAIATGASMLGTECLKGAASEAGKSAWLRIKSLIGWTSDPQPAEIPAKVEQALSVSPRLADQLLPILKASEMPSVTAVVGQLNIYGGKVNIAGHIDTVNM